MNPYPVRKRKSSTTLMMSGDRESSNLLGDGNEKANNKNNMDNTNITKFTFHDEPNKIFSCDT